MKIRLATIDDIPFLSRFAYMVQIESHSTYEAPEVWETISQQYLKPEFWISEFSLPKAVWLSESSSGEIVGYTIWEPHTGPLPLEPNSAYLKKLYISAKFRRHGIGQALLYKVETEVFLAGFTALSLVAHPLNIKSIGFYTHLGYTEAGLTSDEPYHSALWATREAKILIKRGINY